MKGSELIGHIDPEAEYDVSDDKQITITVDDAASSRDLEDIATKFAETLHGDYIAEYNAEQGFYKGVDWFIKQMHRHKGGNYPPLTQLLMLVDCNANKDGIGKGKSRTYLWATPTDMNGKLCMACPLYGKWYWITIDELMRLVNDCTKQLTELLVGNDDEEEGE